MKEQKQFEACAELEGKPLRIRVADFVASPIQKSWEDNPDCNYNSLDALHRIVCGLDEDTFKRYGRALRNIIFPNDEVVTFEMLKATPSQVREALLKATGKWVEDE